MVKILNLKTGVPYSLLIAAVAVILRRFAITYSDIGFYIVLACSYFLISLLCWITNILLIRSPFISLPVYRKTRFFMVSTVIGCVLSLPFAWWNQVINTIPASFLEIHGFDRQNVLLIFFCRGMLFNLLNAFLVSHIKQMKDHEKSQLELEYFKQANLQANLSSLKAQLSPHFLFNTFNTLSSLTADQQVKEYVDHMANVYRYLLEHQKNDMVGLKQELGFAHSYLYIMKTRLEDALQITIEPGLDTSHAMIPPLTLQLLLENAIKHNIASASKPLKIQIFIQDGYLVVVNDLQPRTAVNTSSGIGLTNIDQRYRLLLGREIKIEMDNHFFTVKLPLQT